MMNKFTFLSRAPVVLLGILSFAQAAGAQTFPNPSNGDLLAGFRKTGGNAGSYELVVNIGNITNLEALAPGTTITINNYSTAQLSAAFTDFNNLQWSVSGDIPPFTAFWAGFPGTTIWYTFARSDVNTQTTPPQRMNSQSQIKQWISSVGYGATVISGQSSSNANNTSVLVREPVGDGNALTASIGAVGDSTVGNFNSSMPFSVENTTPASFSTAVRSDLYQSVQIGSTDPITLTTTGLAYYVGYFQLNPSGTMTFTRASAAATPLPPFLKITRVGSTSTVSFLTTNGATYTLYYTNSAGLGTSVSNWPSSPTTVTGDNNTNSIMDTSSDPNRLYRVGAH